MVTVVFFLLWFRLHHFSVCLHFHWFVICFWTGSGGGGGGVGHTDLPWPLEGGDFWRFVEFSLEAVRIVGLHVLNLMCKGSGATQFVRYLLLLIDKQLLKQLLLMMLLLELMLLMLTRECRQGCILLDGGDCGCLGKERIVQRPIGKGIERRRCRRWRLLLMVEAELWKYSKYLNMSLNDARAVSCIVM